MQLEVSLLYNIVKDPHTDYYKNLESMVNYIQGTIGLPLTLSIGKTVDIKWYVDASFVVHR